MVRAVICYWQYNCLAVLSFSQRRVGEKGTKNQNHNKRGQRVSAQITINSSVCWRRAPSYSNHKKNILKSIKALNPRFGDEDTPQAGMFWAFTWQGTPRDVQVSSNSHPARDKPSENRGEDLNHIQWTLLPCQFLTNIQKLLFFTLR